MAQSRFYAFINRISECDQPNAATSARGPRRLDQLKQLREIPSSCAG